MITLPFLIFLFIGVVLAFIIIVNVFGKNDKDAYYIEVETKDGGYAGIHFLVGEDENIKRVFKESLNRCGFDKDTKMKLEYGFECGHYKKIN